MRILGVNADLCNGCGRCEVICAATYFKTDDRRYSSIRVEHASDGAGHLVAFCDQCGECIAVCPTLALARSKNGIVRLQARDCVGCLACVGFCPPLVMYTVPDSIAPIKCIACAKCVDVCPTGALFMTDAAVPLPTTEVTRSIRMKRGAVLHGH